MFGILKKKLGDIVKKFTKEEEQELQVKEESLAEKIEEIKEPVSVPKPEKETLTQEKKESHSEKGGEKMPKPPEHSPEPAPEPESHEEPTMKAEPEIREKEIEKKMEPLEEAEIISAHEGEKPCELHEEPLKYGEEIPEKTETPEEISEREIEKKLELDILETEKEMIRLGAEEGSEEEIEKIEKEIGTDEKTFKPEEEPHAEENPVEEKTKEEPVKEKKPGLLGMIFGKPRQAEKKEEIKKEIKSESCIPEPKEEIPAADKIEPAKKTGIIGMITEKEVSAEEAKKFSDELKVALLESDVALEVSEKICENLEKDITGKRFKRGDAEKMIKQSLRSSIIQILNQGNADIYSAIEKARSEKRPATIVLLGFNGTGKTTTLAKLGFHLKKMGFKPVLAAGDTFRAASIEQLEIHAKNIGADIVKQKYGSDSAAVIFDARERAKAGGHDVVLADTAGRSHSNVNLMDELKKVVRVNNPDMKILVLDSLTGNDIVEQARRFEEAVGIDGIILTKADVYEKGGAALSASFAVRKPILFMGTGQEYESIRKFVPEEIAESLLES